MTLQEIIADIHNTTAFPPRTSVLNVPIFLS